MSEGNTAGDKGSGSIAPITLLEKVLVFLQSQRDAAQEKREAAEEKWDAARKEWNVAQGAVEIIEKTIVLFTPSSLANED